MQSKFMRPVILSVLIINFFIYSPKALAASTKRLMGEDRYRTAVSVSREGWDKSASYAVLVTGENYPDALSAGPLAKKYGAPILLTEKDVLNSDTAMELKRLRVKQVFIIGGTGVISEGVENQLTTMGIKPNRISGADRYETSIKIAEKIGTSTGMFVTTGDSFADALSIAPIAAKKGMPIILVPKDSLPQSITNYIGRKSRAKTYVVCGSGDISQSVIGKFPNIDRIQGNDIFERNINLIKRFSGDLLFEKIYTATGLNFPDGLAASALAAKNSSALVLLNGSYIPDSARSFIKSKVISEVNVLGGIAVIGYSTEGELGNLPDRIVSAYNMNDEVRENEDYTLPRTVTVARADGSKEEMPVTWNLSTVNTGRWGTYTYEGTIKGYGSKVNLTLTVKPGIESIDNITAEVVQNDSFIFPATVPARLSDGSIEDMNVIWDSDVVSMSGVGTYTFTGTIEDFASTATLTLNVVGDSVITFSDYNLANTIRSALGKSSSDSIYKSDVLKIRSFSVGSRGIYDLTGLEHLTNLEYLDLSYNYSINNISALQNLTNLEELVLNNCYIADLTPLQGLRKLTYLNLKNNNITDIAPLRDLSGLRTLFLQYNNITDYSPIRHYYNRLWNRDFNM